MLALLLLTAYLALWPVPLDPQPWNAPPAPGYAGPHAANTRLTPASGAGAIALGAESGPEHIAIGPDQQLYTGVASGAILRMAPDGSGQQVFATTGGRPLGLAFNPDASLAVADAIKGLLRVAPDGAVTVLADRVAGAPILFADGVTVARNGKIYFTDASTRFSPADHGSTAEAAMLDIFEQSATGRVLEYDPATQAVRIVASGLAFPNGILMSSPPSAFGRRLRGKEGDSCHALAGHMPTRVV